MNATAATAQVPTIVANTPAGTQAAMLEAVLNAVHPKIALPSIAHKFGINLAELQTILKRHGYPDAQRMRHAVHQLQLLSEVAPETPTAAAPADVPDGPHMRRVSLEDLHPDPANLREHVSAPRDGDDQGQHVDDIEQLADSIRSVGLLQPIVARETDDGHLVVVAGHRRLAAIKRLRWTHTDVIVRPPMRPDHVVAAMLIENGQRRDLDPIEEARGIRKLREAHNLTDGQVAIKIGRSQSHVSSRLALLTLTPEQQDEVRRGDLGVTHGANLGRLQSGRTRNSAKGHVTVPYYGPTHDLASRAKARCKRLGHRLKIAGGEACGACWESVIRAVERGHLQTLNAKADDCVTCGQPIDHRGTADA